jgi:nitrate reductase alpha subunit
VPNGSLGFRYTASGAGRWNLDLDGVTPQLTLLGEDTVEVLLPRFDSIDGSAAVLRRGVPVRRIGGRLVTTVFDLMLAQYGVHRAGLPGTWPGGYDDVAEPYTPAWQEPITSVPAAQVIRIAREMAPNAEESGGKTMIIMGAGICQWFHGDATYRAVFALLILTGSMGRNGGGWAHYVGQEKCRPATGWGDDGHGHGLAAPAASDDRHRVLVHAHRPVALRRLPRRRAHIATGRGPPGRDGDDRHDRAVGAAGLDAVLSAVRPQPARPRRRHVPCPPF